MLLVRRVVVCCLTADATRSNEAAKCLHDDGQCLLVNRSGTYAACDAGRLTATTVQVQYISKLTPLTSPVVLAPFPHTACEC